MRDEQNRHPTLTKLLDPRKAFALECLVPHRKRLIHNEDIGLDMDGNGECEPHIHTTRIGADWLVNKIANIGKGGNGIEPRGHLLTGQPKNGAIEENIFAASKLRIEPSPQLKQGCNAARNLDCAGRRRKRSTEDL